MLEAGWRALYPDGVGGKKEKEPPVLPPIEVGQEWRVGEVPASWGKETSRRRGIRVCALGRWRTQVVEDEELRQAMKEEWSRDPGYKGGDHRAPHKGRLRRAREEGARPYEQGTSPDLAPPESPLSSPELTGQ